MHKARKIHEILRTGKIIITYRCYIIENPEESKLDQYIKINYRNSPQSFLKDYLQGFNPQVDWNKIFTSFLDQPLINFFFGQLGHLYAYMFLYKLANLFF